MGAETLLRALPQMRPMNSGHCSVRAKGWPPQYGPLRHADYANLKTIKAQKTQEDILTPPEPRKRTITTDNYYNMI